MTSSPSSPVFAHDELLDDPDPDTFTNGLALPIIYTSLNQVIEIPWRSDERIAKRRLVQAFRKFVDMPIDAATAFISCIFWEESDAYVFTSADIIKLGQLLFDIEFDINQKKLLRRDFDRLANYITIKKTSVQHQSFFDLVVGFPNPRPVPNSMDFKVFPWRFVDVVMKVFTQKYRLKAPEWVCYFTPALVSVQHIHSPISAATPDDTYVSSFEESSSGNSQALVQLSIQTWDDNLTSSSDNISSPASPTTENPSSDKSPTSPHDYPFQSPLSFERSPLPFPVDIETALHQPVDHSLERTSFLQHSGSQSWNSSARPILPIIASNNFLRHSQHYIVVEPCDFACDPTVSPLIPYGQPNNPSQALASQSSNEWARYSGSPSPFSRTEYSYHDPTIIVRTDCSPSTPQPPMGLGVQHSFPYPGRKEN